MTLGLVTFDGCGDGDRALSTGWAFSGVTFVESGAASAVGGYGIRLGNAPFNGYGGATRSFADTALPLIGFHWHIVAASPFNEQPLVWLRKDGVTHVQVAVTHDDGRVLIYGPSGAVVAQSDPGAVLYATWYSVEIEASIDDAAGYVKVYLGGDPVAVVEYTGDTKHASASAVVNQVQWWNGEQQRVHLDDVCVLDLAAGSRLGPTYIKGYPPVSDEETDWTPSTGTSHFAPVDEQPFSATDYLSTTEAGNRDRFAIDDGGNVDEVFGARVIGNMQGDSGAESRLVLSDGTNHATGATRSLGAAAGYEDIFDEPPAGGAWGSSSGLQMGVECVTGGGLTNRLNGIGLELLLRRPPGEARVTYFEVFAGTTQEEGPAAVTHEAVQFSGTDDPSEVRVTHESVQMLGGDDPSGARVTHLYVQYLADNVTPPILLRGCDLLLEVFEDDRETVRWRAATRLDYENPYLMMPDRYAEQEIDAASGSATLGTVDVTIVDAPRTAGDQDSGFMTHKLAHQALADIHGRRARLLRAIGDTFEDQVLEVVLDGVAGNPRMDQSYAAFGFTIRDTREVERKIRCFDGSVTGTTIFLPTAGFDDGRLGTLEGYGYNPEDDTYLLPPIVDPPLLLGLSGTFSQNSTDFPNATTGSVDITGNPADRRTVRLNTYQLWEGQVSEKSDTGSIFGIPSWQRVRFPNLKILWRDAGTPSDPFSEIDGAHLVLDIQKTYVRTNLGVVTTDLGNDLVRIDRIAFGDDRIGPAGGPGSDTSPDPYDPPLPGAALPADGQAIEFLLMAAGPASTVNPVHIDNLTAGEFAKNVYDGLYSARDENGEIVPTGILYDEAALLAMTEPVRMRITEPITDARDWLEKHIYAPTGWIPALDIFGRISPVSQEAPTDIFSLQLIYDQITEPSPSWDSGDKIVNVIRFTYKRDYIPHEDVEPETGDGLSDKDVVVEFRDPVSIQRHGEQLLEIDGRAFRAIGTEDKGDPALTAGISAEQGHIHATERGTHLLPRYAMGAPVMTVAVRRAFTPDLRAGSWVRTWLTWFPDYVTQRRGLITLCQIIAIGDLDCVWRQVTMEQVVPLDLYGEGGSSALAMLIDRDGFVLLDRLDDSILIDAGGTLG